MKPINLTPQLQSLIKDQFVLLESVNAKRRLDTVQLRLSGYSDVMYMIADIVKVCILALGDGENHGHAGIPDPASNISGVLGIILDLIPYEETQLLDSLRESILLNPDEPTIVEEHDFILENIFLTKQHTN